MNHNSVMQTYRKHAQVAWHGENNEFISALKQHKFQNAANYFESANLNQLDFNMVRRRLSKKDMNLLLEGKWLSKESNWLLQHQSYLPYYARAIFDQDHSVCYPAIKVIANYIKKEVDLSLIGQFIEPVLMLPNPKVVIGAAYLLRDIGEKEYDLLNIAPRLSELLLKWDRIESDSSGIESANSGYAAFALACALIQAKSQGYVLPSEIVMKVYSRLA